MDKFNYDKANADLHDSGCRHSEEIYNYSTEKGIQSFMRENGLNADKYYKHDNKSNGGNSGGCFLTTACTEAKGLPDNCVELETLRHFRDNYMMNFTEGKRDISHYYKTAPLIVNAINDRPDAKEIWLRIYDELVIPAINIINEGDNAGAYTHYKAYSLSLEGQYLKEGKSLV